MRQTQSQANFQVFASTNTYEDILNRYKTKKDLLVKTAAKQSNKENIESQSLNNKDAGYLSFMEKQLERANRAFAEANTQKETIKDLAERIEIMELAQQDHARKWSLFVNDISAGRQILIEQERDIMRKSIDQLFNRVQEIESRGYTQQQETSIVDRNSGAIELGLIRNIEDRILSQVEVICNERCNISEQRINMMIDNQGKDIAIDFTDLEKKVYEFREQFEAAIVETTTALVRLNQGTSSENAEQIITHTSNLFTQPRLSTSSLNHEFFERALANLKQEIDQKVDYKTFNILKTSIASDIQQLERNLKHGLSSSSLMSPLRPTEAKLFKEIEQRLGAKMTQAIKDIMKKQGGMSDSKRLQGSFSPMSNRSRSGHKASINRSSIKKQNTNYQNEGGASSLLNMSNEMMMRSLSPSIHQQDTRQKNNNHSKHKRRNSSLSPYSNKNEGVVGQQSGKKQSVYNSLTSNGIFNNTQPAQQHESAFRKYQSQIRNSQLNSNNPYNINGSIQSSMRKTVGSKSKERTSRSGSKKKTQTKRSNNSLTMVQPRHISNLNNYQSHKSNSLSPQQQVTSSKKRTVGNSMDNRKASNTVRNNPAWAESKVISTNPSKTSRNLKKQTSSGTSLVTSPAVQQLKSRVVTAESKQKSTTKQSVEEPSVESNRILQQHNLHGESTSARNNSRHTLNNQANYLRSINDFDTPNFDLQSMSPPHHHPHQQAAIGEMKLLSGQKSQSQQLTHVPSNASRLNPLQALNQCSSFVTAGQQSRANVLNNTGGNRSSAASSQSRSVSASKRVQSPNSQQLNASQTERSLQLKVANERLQQLERMYEELSLLEHRAGNKK